MQAGAALFFFSDHARPLYHARRRRRRPRDGARSADRCFLLQNEHIMSGE